jgi:hypothetical protein
MYRLRVGGKDGITPSLADPTSYLEIARCGDGTVRVSIHVYIDPLGGEPILTNCAVLCTNCHGEKTAKGDVPRIAKAVRTYRKNIDARPRPKHRWPSRKFSEQWRA